METRKQQDLIAYYAENGRMQVEAPYTEETQALLAWLPNDKYDPRTRSWYADATPASAWRLKNEGFEICSDLEALADSFGVDHNAPPMTPEKYKFKPWNHQAILFGKGQTSEAVLYDVDMGLGKTKIAIDEIVNFGAMKSLIVCPATVRGTWRGQIRDHLPDDYELEFLVLDKKSWSSKRKAQEMKSFLQRCELNRVPAVVVTNYSTVWRQSMKYQILKHNWDYVACDESQNIKSHGSNASQCLRKIGTQAKYRRCLSGTPLAHSPLDIFGQARFLDPGVYGTSWVNFRARYAVTGHLAADHIVGYKNEDELAELMSHFTIHMTADDADIELPELVEQAIDVELEPKTRKIYNELQQESIAMINDGVITVDNALTKMMKLRQITSGFIIDEDGTVEAIGKEKEKALATVIDGIEPGDPLIVFCNFTEDLNRIQKTAARMGRKYGELSGRVKDITEDSKMPAGIDVYGVQVKSGGTGIDLTRARHVLYFDCPWSLADYRQSMKRAYRPGQNRRTFIRSLVAKDTVDERVVANLQRRQKVVDGIIDYMLQHQG